MRSVLAALLVALVGCKKVADRPPEPKIVVPIDSGVALVARAAPATPEVIATGFDNEGVIAVDAASAYWVDGSGLASAPKHGGQRASLDPASTRAEVLFVDGADVYYGGHFGFRGLHHLHAPDLSPTDAMPVRCFAADAEALYWMEMEQEPRPVDGLHGTLWRGPKGGPRTVVTRVGAGDSCTVDDTHVFWSETPHEGRHVVRARPKAGGATKTIRELAGSPRGDNLRVDGNRMYWTEFKGVASGEKLGGPVTRVPLPVERCSFEDLVLDDTHVFVSCTGWPGASTGSVWRIPKNGGSPRCLAGKLPEPAGLAVDHESVYWAYRVTEPSPANGGIARIAKDAPGVDDEACLSK